MSKKTRMARRAFLTEAQENRIWELSFDATNGRMDYRFVGFDADLPTVDDNGIIRDTACLIWRDLDLVKFAWVNPLGEVKYSDWEKYL